MIAGTAMKTMLALILACASPLAFAAIDISMQGLVEAVVYMLVVGFIFGLLFFLVRKAPFIPEPWKAFINYFIIFVAVLILINILLGMVGSPIFRLR